jgi:hypothetical protein
MYSGHTRLLEKLRMMLTRFSHNDANHGYQPHAREIIFAWMTTFPASGIGFTPLTQTLPNSSIKPQSVQAA